MRNIQMYGLTIKSKSKKWNKIINHFSNIAYLNMTSDKVPYSIIYYDNDGKNKNTGYIYFRYETICNPSEEDLMDLLHEIGHIITNKPKMKRCTEEYLATQWAIDNAQKFGMKFTNKRIEEFQNYIFKWRETSIKHNAKNVPTKKQLTLTV